MAMAAIKMDTIDRIDPRELRTALSQFATGVTVVTCHDGTGPVGMTANSFASVSLDPALVLWSVAKSSRRHDCFVNAADFAIHVLSADQGDLCKSFAKSADAFGGCDHRFNEHGVPIIENCLARFECRTYAKYDGGDHTIILGQVEQITTTANKPLIFAQGEFLGKV